MKIKLTVFKSSHILTCSFMSQFLGLSYLSFKSLVQNSVFPALHSVRNTVGMKATLIVKQQEAFLQERAQPRWILIRLVCAPRGHNYPHQRRSGFLSKWTLSCHLPKMYQTLLLCWKTCALLEPSLRSFGLMNRTEEILLFLTCLTSQPLFGTLLLLCCPSLGTSSAICINEIGLGHGWTGNRETLSDKTVQEEFNFPSSTVNVHSTSWNAGLSSGQRSEVAG